MIRLIAVYFRLWLLLSELSIVLCYIDCSSYWYQLKGALLGPPKTEETHHYLLLIL